MKKTNTATAASAALMVICTVCLAEPVSAGIEAECRKEAQDYEVVPEQRDDYIAGCIDSRGGVITPDNIEEDSAPVVESDEANEPAESAEDAVQ